MIRTFYFLLFAFFILSAAAQINDAARVTLSPAYKPFYHGVASGDPLADKIMLWTRCTPDTGISGSLDVYWQIATDTNFSNIVNYGFAKALPENDYTVKVDACGLQPNTWYYYVFQHNGQNSITGRTRTAPLETSQNDSARFAVVSCADFKNGYFNAYQNIADRNDVDAVIHLGDYIYEYANSGGNSGRTVEPVNEIITQSDYRLRHSNQKLDYQLKRCHQMYPFICVWDDHETANNSWRDGAENHQANEGPWSARKWNGVNAYYEWIPIRRPDLADSFRIYRNFKWGKLANLVMLDSRLYDRDEVDGGKRNDSTHHLLGPVQQNWMLQQLSDTTSQWKIIGNQVMFAPLTVFGAPVNNDQWDGYAFQRNKVQNHILNNNINDVVIITGDIHTSWANDVPGANYNANTGAGSVCVEFVGSSITSANSPLPVGISLIKSLNPHMKYINLDDFGYYTLDLKKNRTQADYRYLPINQISSTVTNGESWYVNKNERFLRKATAQIAAPKIAAPVPSLWPNNTIPFAKIERVKTITIHQNNAVSVAVIPNAAVCPAIGLSIIDDANYGSNTIVAGSDVLYQPQHNFTGKDTILLAVCESLNPIQCDTVSIIIDVLPNIKTDTVEVEINQGAVYNNCRAFDDLYGTITSSSIVAPLAGSAIQNNDSCLLYTPATNFCGYENVLLIACDAAPASKCDTVFYRFRVNLPVVKDVVTLSVLKTDSIQYCIQYNDLKSKVSASQVLVQAQNGTVTFANDTCFKYTPNGTATQDVMVVTGCDNCTVQNCDTIEILFNIIPAFATETFTFNAAPGAATAVCYNFDEASAPYSSVNVIQPHNNALLQVVSDTCFNYYAAANFTGVDTIFAIACNNTSPNNCDTVRILVYVNVNALPQVPQTAVLGVYPNPFSDGLVVHYYAHQASQIDCKMYDAAGRVVMQQHAKDKSVGLHYMGFNTEKLPAGMYVVELKDGQKSFRRQVLRK